MTLGAFLVPSSRHRAKVTGPAELLLDLLYLTVLSIPSLTLWGQVVGVSGRWPSSVFEIKACPSWYLLRPLGKSKAALVGGLSLRRLIIVWKWKHVVAPPLRELLIKPIHEYMPIGRVFHKHKNSS